MSPLRGSLIYVYIHVYKINTWGLVMENFEALQSIDNFCKVLVKKTIANKSEIGNKRVMEASNEAGFDRNYSYRPLESYSAMGYMQPEIEEPLIDVFDEEDSLRILVQCRCREQQVTFYPDKDGVIICREECYHKKGQPETCGDVCRKLNIRTDELQLENMQFIIARCNSNNTLEAMIPKIKKTNL